MSTMEILSVSAPMIRGKSMVLVAFVSEMRIAGVDPANIVGVTSVVPALKSTPTRTPSNEDFWRCLCLHSSEMIHGFS